MIQRACALPPLSSGCCCTSAAPCAAFLLTPGRGWYPCRSGPGRLIQASSLRPSSRNAWRSRSDSPSRSPSCTGGTSCRERPSFARILRGRRELDNPIALEQRQLPRDELSLLPVPLLLEVNMSHSTASPEIRIKRAYDPAAPNDGTR